MLLTSTSDDIRQWKTYFLDFFNLTNMSSIREAESGILRAVGFGLDIIRSEFLKALNGGGLS